MVNETTELIMKQLNSKKVHAETHELGGGDEIDVLKLKNAGSLVTKTGDFSGTWNGLAMTSVEPGLSTSFNALKADTATKANQNKSNRPERKLLPAFGQWELVGTPIANNATWKNRYAGIGYDVVWDEDTQKYAMIYCGAETGGTTKFGIAYSNDAVNWTDYGSNPIFLPNPTPGQLDSGGVTYPQLVRENGKWYMFYIGFANPGYEQGTPRIFYATADSFLGTWTYKGCIVNPDNLPSSMAVVYRPTVFKVGNTWYMVTNAGSTVGWEDIWYLTAPSIDGPWTVGQKLFSGTDINKANNGHIASDPEVVRFGDWFIMFVWSTAGIHMAYCDISEFPNTWHPIDTALPITGAPQRACWVETPSDSYLFVNGGSGTNISIYKQPQYIKASNATTADTANGINVSQNSYRGMFGSASTAGWATFNFHSGGARKFGMGVSPTTDNMNFYKASGVAGSEIEDSVMTLNNATGIFSMVNGVNIARGAGTTGINLRGGSAPPAVGLGSDGDFYFRSDAATGSAIYQKRAGAWVAIL